MTLISSKDLIEGDVFELMGLQNLSEEKKEELMAQMIDGLQARVLVRIDDLITDIDREEFHKLLDEESDEKINEYLRTKNIDVKKITAEEALLMKSQIIEKAKALKE